MEIDDNDEDYGDEYTYDDDDNDSEGNDDVDDIIQDNVVNNIVTPANVEGISSSKKSAGKDNTSSHKSVLSKVPDGKVVITDYIEIIPLMENIIHEVSTLLDIDHNAAQLLLQFSQWNKEKLIDTFFSNTEKVLLDAGLDLYSRDVSLSVLSPIKLLETNILSFKCKICCDDCEIKDALSLGCGHQFCRKCYADYLTNQVADGPICIRAFCPEHKCLQAIPRSFFKVI